MYTSVSSAPCSFTSSLFSSSALSFSLIISLSLGSFGSFWSSFSPGSNSFLSLGLLGSPLLFGQVIFLFTFDWCLVAW